MTRSIFVFFILVVSACGQRDVLTENTWKVIGGTYKGQRIEFRSTDPVAFVATTGEEILNFNKDESIVLPGINSGSIPAGWSIIDDKIRFSFDTTVRPHHIQKPDPRVFTDSAYQEAAIDMGEFKMPMRFYRQTFEYHISLDTLRLFSKEASLWAVRDKRIDEIFRHMR